MSINSRFAKTRDCPTNESLWQWLTDAPNAEEAQTIVAHLAICEFCELSLELLRSLPAQPDLAPSSIPPLPASLAHLFTANRENK